MLITKVTSGFSETFSCWVSIMLHQLSCTTRLLYTAHRILDFVLVNYYPECNVSVAYPVHV